MLVRIAPRRIPRNYTNALSAKTEKQTIQHGRRNAQFVGESRRGLGRHIDSGQSNSRKESKSRSKSKSKSKSESRNPGGTTRQTPYPPPPPPP